MCRVEKFTDCSVVSRSMEKEDFWEQLEMDCWETQFLSSDGCGASASRVVLGDRGQMQTPVEVESNSTSVRVSCGKEVSCEVGFSPTRL